MDLTHFNTFASSLWIISRTLSKPWHSEVSSGNVSKKQLRHAGGFLKILLSETNCQPFPFLKFPLQLFFAARNCWLPSSSILLTTMRTCSWKWVFPEEVQWSVKLSGRCQWRQMKPTVCVLRVMLDDDMRGIGLQTADGRPSHLLTSLLNVDINSTCRQDNCPQSVLPPWQLSP